jgi:hypothetical protein
MAKKKGKDGRTDKYALTKISREKQIITSKETYRITFTGIARLKHSIVRSYIN